MQLPLANLFRKLQFVSVLLLISTVAMGQNIVPNYSFELSDSCPTQVNCCPSYYGSGYWLGCKYWAQGTKASSDYFHACNTTLTWTGHPSVGVPDNSFGNQNAFEGNAYAGAIVYTGTYQEYLMAEIPALASDTPYEVTIHVSLADRSHYAVNGFGVLFTTFGSPDTSTWAALHQTPQVDYSSYGIISDSVHWTTLTKTFVADSLYKYILIGVFKTHPDTLNIYTPITGDHRVGAPSYYYFDNISVKKLSTADVSEANGRSESSVKPNPVHSTLTVTASTELNRIEIYNLMGQSVYHGIHHEKHVEINVEYLPAGVYLLKVNGTETKKFVKQ